MNGNFRDRRNWTRSLTMVVIVAVVAVVIGCMVDKKADKTDRFYLKSAAGAVLFDHEKHSQATESCAQCHHDLYGAEQAILCAECHDEELDSNEFDHSELKEIHNRNCSKCHDVIAEEDQIVSCRTCHPGLQEGEQNTVSCTECHDDGYSPDMMQHDEYMEMEEHSCLGCHTPKSVSEAYHTNCSHCHLETSPERFTQAGGDVNCGACHLR